jgi:hypothetical protein
MHLSLNKAGSFIKYVRGRLEVSLKMGEEEGLKVGVKM